MGILPNHMLRDVDIRTQLIAYLNIGSKGSNFCVEELGICGGESRIDIALLDEGIHGYEIKSEADSLDRLSRQVSIYNRALNFATIVSAERHLPKLYALIPDWWGVMRVSRSLDDPATLEFSVVRPATANPAPDLFAVAQFLWRDEALEILTDSGLDKGLRTKPRRRLWEQLASDNTPQSLFEKVVEKLSSRGDWRTVKL